MSSICRFNTNLNCHVLEMPNLDNKGGATFQEDLIDTINQILKVTRIIVVVVVVVVVVVFVFCCCYFLLLLLLLLLFFYSFGSSFLHLLTLQETIAASCRPE